MFNRVMIICIISRIKYFLLTIFYFLPMVPKQINVLKLFFSTITGLSPAGSNHSILRRLVNLDAEGRNAPCLVSLTRQPRGPDEEGKGFQLVRKLS